MNIIIVGRKAEKRQVQWVAFLTLAVMLFVLVDGWHLISGSLLKSFGV